MNKHSHHSDRLAAHAAITAELALMDDQHLSTLLNQAKTLSRSMWSATNILQMGDKQIFVKKIPLSDIEKSAENKFSTSNFFKLPMFYHYGVGSAGYGIWRELQAHMRSTEWVISGQCQHFPILYHYRILSEPVCTTMSEELKQLNESVKYWDNSEAVRNRLQASLQSSASLVLFLEYFPDNLVDFLKKQLSQGGHIADAACQMIDNNLVEITTFMKSQSFLHFDAHFYNIMTEGDQLYFSDFGLAMSSQFEFSAEEREFFNQHIDYDYYCVVMHLLYSIITHFYGDENWIKSLKEFLDGKCGELSSYMTSVIKRYSPIAIEMDAFLQGLIKDKTTVYPAAFFRRD